MSGPKASSPELSLVCPNEAPSVEVRPFPFGKGEQRPCVLMLQLVRIPVATPARRSPAFGKRQLTKSPRFEKGLLKKGFALVMFAFLDPAILLLTVIINGKTLSAIMRRRIVVQVLAHIS